MADMNATDYRKELRMFRGALTLNNPQGGKRLRKPAGYQWYNVYAEPTLHLYIELPDLYMKAFRNGGGAFRFYHEPNPGGPQGGIINATELQFLDSYNGNGEREGIGLDQTTARTVTLFDLNQAFAVMAGGDFGAKNKDAQRLNIARVVIGLIEGARFKDVEDQVVAGTPITDRKWKKHTNQQAVRIEHD